MRLGLEADARRERKPATGTAQGSRHGEYAAAARQLQNFVVAKSAHTILQLDRKEAELLRPYFERSCGGDRGLRKEVRLQAGTAVQLECIPTRGFRGAHAGMPGWARWG